MRLTKAKLAAAPLCANCHDYIDEPDCKLVKRKRGWVHVGNNSVRCAGQEDDDTDDRGVPLRVDGKYVTSFAEDDDPPVFDTAREAWQYLLEELERSATRPIR